MSPLDCGTVASDNHLLIDATKRSTPHGRGTSPKEVPICTTENVACEDKPQRGDTEGMSSLRTDESSAPPDANIVRSFNAIGAALVQ